MDVEREKVKHSLQRKAVDALKFQIANEQDKFKRASLEQQLPLATKKLHTLDRKVKDLVLQAKYKEKLISCRSKATEAAAKVHTLVLKSRRLQQSIGTLKKK